jgi:hypothetical protein
LGQFDVVETRLRAADTVIFLDFSFWCCSHRAIRRSRERIDFWWWVLAYRWKSRPVLLKAIADYAPSAKLYVFRDPDSLQQLVDQLAIKASVLGEPGWGCPRSISDQSVIRQLASAWSIRSAQ